MRSALYGCQCRNAIGLNGDEPVESDYPEHVPNVRLKGADVEDAVLFPELLPQSQEGPQACGAKICDLRSVYDDVLVGAGEGAHGSGFEGQGRATVDASPSLQQQCDTIELNNFEHIAVLPSMS